ncbi:hypothetical protein GOV13_04660 [Candidatus Pacearchaeota archaeon]|nr:hypothetical protein [Candidatus Pacearchaeota archaeon]
MPIYFSEVIERLEKNPQERHSLYVLGGADKVEEVLSRIEGVEVKINPLDVGYDVIINGGQNA